MKDSAYAFSVSAVRVRETSLLTKAQIETLVTAPNEASVLRLLEDYGYSGITEGPEYAIAERLREITKFINDVCPDGDLLSFLFVKNDFHNLKAAMKCAVSGIEPDGYFLPPSSLTYDEIKKAVSEKRFGDLPEVFSAASEAWDALTRTMNGQICEMILDRGAIEASVKIAEMTEDEFCMGLADMRARMSAIIIAYRCAAAEKSKDFINSALPEVSGIDKKALVSAALAGCDEVVALSEKYGVPTEDAAGAKDIVLASERLEDEYAAKSAFVSMGTAPIISYYLKAEREIARIRVILSCKRCGFAEDVIRRRAGI